MINQAPVSIDYPNKLNFSKLVWSQSVGVEKKRERSTLEIMSMQNLKITIIIHKYHLVSVWNQKAAADGGSSFKMYGPQPVNASILLDSLMLVSILTYYLGLCFILCRNTANLLTLVMFLLQLKYANPQRRVSFPMLCSELLLCAIIFVGVFLEIVK